jgi:hypothetical protein
MERESGKVHIILSNNFSYTGTIISEDEFFITLLDKFNEEVRLGKKDIQTIRRVHQ